MSRKELTKSRKELYERPEVVDLGDVTRVTRGLNGLPKPDVCNCSFD